LPDKLGKFLWGGMLLPNRHKQWKDNQKDDHEKNCQWDANATAIATLLGSIPAGGDEKSECMKAEFTSGRWV
jgi:hypothetical protein